jgi:hypothetical protein
MIHGIHTDVLMVAAYALLLAAAAAVLELVARQSHRMAERFHVAGFTYHPQFDLWRCPTGQHLERKEADYARRIVRYQALAHACNSCHCKADCTDSADGRQIEHHLDSWLESELRRFHRGLSLVLLLLAGLILAFEMRDRDTLRDWMVLGGLILPITGFGTRLLTEFVSRRARFAPRLD